MQAKYPKVDKIRNVQDSFLPLIVRFNAIFSLEEADEAIAFCKI